MKSKDVFVCCLFLCLAGMSRQAYSQTTISDDWAVTDALGRKAPDYQEVGGKKKDKFVALFYWTWHQGNDAPFKVRNITKIVRKHPEAMRDYNNPAWGNNRPFFYYWEQPLFGYYKTGCSANMQRCLQMPALTSSSLIVPMVILPGKIHTRR